MGDMTHIYVKKPVTLLPSLDGVPALRGIVLQQCLDSFNSLLDDSLLPLAAFLLGAPPAGRQRLCCLSSIARIQKNAFNDGGGNVGGSEGALVSRPALCALHLASI